MDSVNPMLAQTGDEPFDNPDYIYDLKYNGMRIVGHKDGGSAMLQGRSGLDYTAQFPELFGLAKNIKPQRGSVDGEVVCLGADGLPDFNALQQRIGQTNPLTVKALMERYPAIYQVFEVARVDDFDLTAGGKAKANQMQRREILEKILIPDDKVRLSPYVDGSGTELMEQVKAINDKAGRQVFDGVMAKTKSGLYTPGGRGSAWTKFKIPHYANYVICGWTKGTGVREEVMGAVVLGKPENGGLRFVGCAGSGFHNKTLHNLYETLSSLRTDVSPFPNGTKVPKLASWVQPVLVVYIKYYDITKTGQLIWPIFQHLQSMFTPEDIS
ncbi:Multifunctional non-homologous end joining protein LigD [subsurface metagenome]